MVCQTPHSGVPIYRIGEECQDLGDDFLLSHKDKVRWRWWSTQQEVLEQRSVFFLERAIEEVQLPDLVKVLIEVTMASEKICQR